MKLSHVALLAAVGGLFAGGIAQATSTPVLYYTLSNSEVSGNGSTGTTVTAETGQVGTVTTGSVTVGQSSVPAAFTGQQSIGFGSGLLSATVSSGVSGTNAFSFDFWVNPSASAGSQEYISVDNAISQYAILYQYGGSGVISLFIDGAEPGAVTVAPNTWTNVAYSYNGNVGGGTLTTYLNGVSQGTVTGLGLSLIDWQTSATNDYIVGGAGALYPSNDFDGSLFNYQLFNNAITQADVTTFLTPTSVPEPASLSLLGLGALGLLARRRSQKA